MPLSLHFFANIFNANPTLFHYCYCNPILYGNGGGLKSSKFISVLDWNFPVTEILSFWFTNAKKSSRFFDEQNKNNDAYPPGKSLEWKVRSYLGLPLLMVWRPRHLQDCDRCSRGWGRASVSESREWARQRNAKREVVDHTPNERNATDSHTAVALISKETKGENVSNLQKCKENTGESSGVSNSHKFH